MQYILGIDEAGRGALVGPLVLSGVLIKSDKSYFLKNLNIKDSKKLSSKKRSYLYEIIIDEATNVFVQIAWPELIDAYVFNHKLNLLEAELMAKLINSLNIDAKIIIDSPQNPVSFISLLKTCNIDTTNITCEFSADANYLEVAAASIVSKVIRDNIIANLRKTYGDFNSGYPSDIKTINFVKSNYKQIASCIRKSWNLK